jgi:hypothetical protein
MWKLQTDIFPEGSVAVMETVLSPLGNTEPDGGFAWIAALQLSVALNEKVTRAPQIPGSVFTVLSPGQIINGLVLSVTRTVNEQCDIFPCLSVAVDCTVVNPIGKSVPDGGMETTVAEQLSVAVTEKFTIAPQEPGSLYTLMFEGQFITGASLSVTVTVNVQIEIFPCTSVAVD